MISQTKVVVCFPGGEGSASMPYWSMLSHLKPYL